MVALGIVELEGVSDATEDAVGDTVDVSAFQPDVVLDADPGTQGDLFAPAEELTGLPVVRELTDSGGAYVLAKRANILRVQAQSVLWGDRGARLNSISPGIICTPLALHELASPDAAVYQAMLDACAAGRMGTPTEVAEIAALLLGPAGRYFSGSDLLMDGGVIAAQRAGRLGAYERA